MPLPPLSILESGLINPPELHAYEAINSLLQDVGQFEALGYKRLWLTEHYSREFAWFNPECLLPLLAGYSEKIRIGMAGVLLSYHSPLRVAQSFKILSALYHDRIDLGIARAYVPDYINKYLAPQADPAHVNADWDEKIRQLTLFTRQTDPENCLMRNMLLPPHGTSLPDLWMLGSSSHSVQNAVANECNFCISFTHPGSDFSKNVDTIKIYQDEFFKAHGRLPATSVLVWCVHTDDKEAAELNRQYDKCAEANLFGNRNFIADKLHELQSILANDEFVLFSPIINRTRRMESFAAVQGA
jgi:alkanesulfonate monooxygenase SsuD/methylene tetrahydromethanopterin reductase-like flavin-dependent oxidoreductase (luciferase family)